MKPCGMSLGGASLATGAGSFDNVGCPGVCKRVYETCDEEILEHVSQVNAHQLVHIDKRMRAKISKNM